MAMWNQNRESDERQIENLLHNIQKVSHVPLLFIFISIFCYMFSAQKVHLHPLRWRRGDWRTTTQVEAIPNVVRNESVVVKCNSLSVMPIYAHLLWLPTIVSTPVQIQVTYLVRTRTVYLKRIRRAPLECPRRRVIYPRCIHLQIQHQIHQQNTWALSVGNLYKT